MELEICPYFDSCNVINKKKVDCIDYGNCQAFAIYQKYEQEQFERELLGIGAVRDVSFLKNLEGVVVKNARH